MKTYQKLKEDRVAWALVTGFWDSPMFKIIYQGMNPLLYRNKQKPWRQFPCDSCDLMASGYIAVVCKILCAQPSGSLIATLLLNPFHVANKKMSMIILGIGSTSHLVSWNWSLWEILLCNYSLGGEKKTHLISALLCYLQEPLYNFRENLCFLIWSTQNHKNIPNKGRVLPMMATFLCKKRNFHLKKKTTV